VKVTGGRMSIMAKHLVAIAVVVAGVAAPLAGQRDGNHGGLDSHGGVASHSTPIVRGGSPPMMARPTTVGVEQYRIGQSSGPILINRYVPVAPEHRVGFGGGEVNHRRNSAGEHREHRVIPEALFSVGLPYSVTYVGPTLSDGLDSGSYENHAMTAPLPPAMYSNEPAAQPVQEQVEAPVAPTSTYRPEYQRALPPRAEPEPQIAVTLVFKDGRPQEQIYNYMLTRTKLYVQGSRLREIAVADLDLDATTKVNHEAGVDFRLPDSGR